MAARMSSRGASELGYAMAALLVALGAMAVFASMAMPVWRTVLQREKEEELIFRGQQYVRSIRLFQRKFANAYPPNLDLLIDQRFLRRKYKDPMSGDADFVILYQSMIQQARPGAAGQPGAAGGRAIGGRAGEVTPPTAIPQTPLANLDAAGPRGGIVGVVSRNTGTSFRTYNGRSAYNQWQFIFVQTGMPGQGGAPVPGGRGGPGMTQPGGGMGGPMGNPMGGRGQGGRGAGPGGGSRGGGGGRGGPGNPPLN